MSTYPGESPQPPDGEQSDPAGTEPTQPVGYWERQAAERAHEEQPQVPQDSPSPTTPYPQNPNPYPFTPPGQEPYAAQPGYPPSGSHAGPPPGQAGPHHYPPVPGGVPGQMPYTAYSPQAPDHPQSTLALVLGLVGLVGAFVLCGVTLVVSPFAWAVGHSAVKEIEASQGRLGGLSNARAGMIMGIIGTVLLILAILAVIGFVVLVVAAETSSPGSSV
ncbi:MAG: DUF4190 domain-containing protein [Marmoricola sp.]